VWSHKNWAGSDQGGHHAATIYSLVETAELNKVDPDAWLRDTIDRMSDHPQRRIDKLLPWHYQPA
jgi:transposase